MEHLSALHPSASLAEARARAAARDWQGLARMAAELPPEQLQAEPELGYLCADSLHRTGSAERALQLATALEPALRRNGDRRLMLRLVNLIGVVLFETGRSDEAEQRFGDLLEEAVTWGDDEFAARASNNLGVISNIRGRKEMALTYYERALAAYQRLGHVRGLAQTYYNLGITYRDLDRPADAEDRYRRATELAEQSQSMDVVALAETERAVLHVRGGDALLAERWARRALQRFEQLGDPVRRAEAVRVLASSLRARGRLEEARDCLVEAAATAARANLLLRAEVQRDLGLLLRDLGQLAEARDALLDAAAHFERLGSDADARDARDAAPAPP